MSNNGPWGFGTFAPSLCQIFLKEPIGRFWGKVWISIASHGFLVWPWQNIDILTNHTYPLRPFFKMLHLFLGQFCLCKGKGVDVIVGQVVHPWQFGIKGAKGDLWVWNMNLVMWEH